MASWPSARAVSAASVSRERIAASGLTTIRAVTSLSRACSLVAKRCSHRIRCPLGSYVPAAGKFFMRSTVACNNDRRRSTPISLFRKLDGKTPTPQGYLNKTSHPVP